MTVSPGHQTLNNDEYVLRATFTKMQIRGSQLLTQVRKNLILKLLSLGCLWSCTEAGTIHIPANSLPCSFEQCISYFASYTSRTVVYQPRLRRLEILIFCGHQYEVSALLSVILRL